MTQECAHEWIAMTWQEAYPASDGRKCSKCGKVDLAWLGARVSGDPVPLASNPVVLLVKRMRSLADLASHKEPAISEALIDGAIQIERLDADAANEKAERESWQAIAIMRQESLRKQAEVLWKMHAERDRLSAALEDALAEHDEEHGEDCECSMHWSSRARMMLSGEQSGHETAAAQAPIVRVVIENGKSAYTTIYAPGLPDGTHDLYCEPEAVAPMMRAEKASGEST